jgi:transmembrane sensor
MGEGGKTGEQLRAEAIGWLVALDCGSADAQAFEAWRQASPYHASAFAQAAAVWRTTADRRLTAMIDQAPEEPALPAELSPPADEGKGGFALSRRVMAGGGVAALLGLGAMGGWLTLPGRAYATTGIGEQRTLRLPDGSHAMLNTDTRVAWRFGHVREFWVEQGEVALSVREDPATFTLHSAPLDARLGGGSFNLRLSGQEGRLLTLGGEARLADARRVGAGQIATGQGGAITIATAPADVLGTATSWQQGRIVFNGMPLSQAVEEFNRYLPIKIALQDGDLAQTRLGGEFRIDDPDRFLAALSSGFDIAHRQQGNQILLYRMPGGYRAR